MASASRRRVYALCVLVLAGSIATLLCILSAEKGSWCTLKDDSWIGGTVDVGLTKACGRGHCQRYSQIDEWGNTSQEFLDEMKKHGMIVSVMIVCAAVSFAAQITLTFFTYPLNIFDRWQRGVILPILFTVSFQTAAWAYWSKEAKPYIERERWGSDLAYGQSFVLAVLAWVFSLFVHAASVYLLATRPANDISERSYYQEHDAGLTAI